MRVMVALGALLAILGAVLLVAEAHLPTAGALGVLGALALAGGLVLALSAAGGAALAVPVGLAVGLLTIAFVALAARKAGAARRVRVRSGPESLVGQIGVVRDAGGPVEHVFVGGALWRARPAWQDEEARALHSGDPVVVEGVNGLTLSVRAAEEWEVPL